MCYGSAEVATARLSRRSRKGPALVVLSVMSALPAASMASDVVEQEFSTAIHARPSQMHGEALFNDTCIACHGPDGAGQPDGSVPSIAAQHSRYIIRQLVDYRHGRRWDLRMEHSTGPRRLVNGQDIADVAAYVSRLPPPTAVDIGNGELATSGQLIYARACAPCHGNSGAGDDTSGVPRLAGQHYSYLLRQMIDAMQGQRPEFPREHSMLLQRLERNDLIGLADFLSRSVASPDRPRRMAHDGTP